MTGAIDPEVEAVPSRKASILIEGCLLGVIVTASLTAVVFFWRLHRRPGLPVFAAIFAIHSPSGGSITSVHVDRATEQGRSRRLFGAPYLARPIAFASLLGAIVSENRRQPTAASRTRK
jgi:hypothetical protein